MTTNHVTPNVCSNCGDSVPRRRPSSTGQHWCSRQQCRAAKQRWYYANRSNKAAAELEAATLEKLKLGLLASVSSLEKFLTEGCPDCGRADALLDWVHPTPAWDRVCLGTGIGGNDVEALLPYFKMIWPEHCPFVFHDIWEDDAPGKLAFS